MSDIDEGLWSQRELTLEAWPTSDGVDVGSDYSRTVWLPSLGPGGWLMWTTAAERLRGVGLWVGLPEELSRPPDLVVTEISAGLEALALAGLARRLRADRWRVRVTCPAPDKHAILVHYEALRRQAARERQVSDTGRPLAAVPSSPRQVARSLWAR